MALVPTNFLRDRDFSKELLSGVANAQMGILLNQMRLGKLNCAKRTLEFSTGVIIECVVNYRDRHLNIFVPEGGGTTVKEEYVVGFMCHPGIAHAYDQVQDGTRGGNRVVYWDKDKWKTQLKVVKITTDLLGNIISVDYAGDEYGNIDWKGPKQDPEIDPYQFYRKILTWKGPPSRYFPLGLQDDIEGVTTTDHIIEGLLQDTIYTTPFTGNVYEHGRVVAKMPSLYWPLGLNDKHEAQVLGAAYREVDGKLIVVVKTCYNAYPRAKEPEEMVSTWQVRHNGLFYQEWLEDRTGADAQVLTLGTGYETVEVPDPGRAYWFEVLVKESGPSLAGWNRLLQISTDGTMPDANWFFSEDGTQVVSVMHGVLHSIVIALVDGVSSATHTTTSLGSPEAHVSGSYSSAGTNEYEVIASEFPLVSLPEGGERRADYYDYAQGSADAIAYVLPFSPPVPAYNVITSVASAITRDGSLIIAADFKENTVVYATAVISGTETSSTYQDVTHEIKGVVSRAMWYDPADHTPAFTWQWSWAGTGQSIHVGERVWIAITEMCRPTVTYSISGGSIDTDGTILSVPCVTCDTWLTVTVHAESKEGKIDSTYDFLLPATATWEIDPAGTCVDPTGLTIGTWYAGGTATPLSELPCYTTRWKIVSVTDSGVLSGLENCGLPEGCSAVNSSGEATFVVVLDPSGSWWLVPDGSCSTIGAAAVTYCDSVVIKNDGTRNYGCTGRAFASSGCGWYGFMYRDFGYPWPAGQLWYACCDGSNTNLYAMTPAYEQVDTAVYNLLFEKAAC